MRREEPARLGDILPDALRELGVAPVWLESRVRRAWSEAAGPQLAQVTSIARLRGTTLEVSVASDAWATEVRFLGPQLCERINAILGLEAVREVVVRRRRPRP